MCICKWFYIQDVVNKSILYMYTTPQIIGVIIYLFILKEMYTFIPQACNFLHCYKNSI